VQADKAKAAVEEWAPMALKVRGAGLPASVCGRIQSEVPDGSHWAIADEARTFWALGPDDVLRELTLEAGSQVSSTSRRLPGCRITVSHTTSLVEDYRDTETRQLHHWKFSVDGTQLLALTGTVYSERGRPRDRPDRQQVLALALEELARRSRP
jgi:hypothetical protein